MTPKPRLAECDGAESRDARDAELWGAYTRFPSPTGRDRLFANHFPFARSIANRLYRERSYGDVDLADLNQLAAEGLLEALDGFDPARGVPFNAYAARRITGSILDGLARMSEAREQSALRHRLRQERLRSLTGKGSSGKHSADALGALVELAVGLAVGFMLEDTALFRPAHDELAVSADPTGYDSLLWKQTISSLSRQVGALPERERSVIEYHYMGGLNFERIANLLGVTKGRVSQLHRSALEGLRSGLREPSSFKLER